LLELVGRDGWMMDDVEVEVVVFVGWVGRGRR
jgi:hypothetical protein